MKDFVLTYSFVNSSSGESKKGGGSNKLCSFLLLTGSGCRYVSEGSRYPCQPNGETHCPPSLKSPRPLARLTTLHGRGRKLPVSWSQSASPSNAMLLGSGMCAASRRPVPSYAAGIPDRRA